MTPVELREAGDRIEAFVRSQFNVGPNDPGFDRRTDLFEAGYVDSVGVVETLEFIRVEFGVDVPEDDLLSEDFATIDGIARVVCRLLGS